MGQTMTERRAEVGGIGVRWDEVGDGIPVVLLHGIPTSPALWRHVMPRLRGARCLAWEMVSYGASIPEWRGRDISVSAQADYLLGWLQSLGTERSAMIPGRSRASRRCVPRGRWFGASRIWRSVR